MTTANNTVYNFYKNNAQNFSKTRNNPWPATKSFLNNIQVGSNVLDIGCGNGRNLFYRSDLDMVGLELSQELCNIVKSRGGNVFNGNMVNLPFSDNTFDYIICVAVYHHLDNDKDRQTSLNEMHRVLKKGGNAFIQVWAMEQPFNSRRKFMKRDEYVPWKNKDGTILHRYYHIYPKEELEKEILKLTIHNDNNLFKIKSTEYEEGNWICIIEK
jgi:ubiquinone/menaquinone biosynthesis C-methylase UbiE